jgi:hypothetical protein
VTGDGAQWPCRPGRHGPSVPNVTTSAGWHLDTTGTEQTGSAAVVVSWVLTVVTVGYFLPWAIAETRGTSNSLVIGLLNFLLGWTIIGWIVALVMACTSHQRAIV